MHRYYIIDGHCDVLTKLRDDRISLHKRTINHIDINSLIAGRVGLQFFAAWIEPKHVYASALQRCLCLIDTFYMMLDKYEKYFKVILDFNDITNISAQNKIGALLSIEGGEALEGQLENLRMFYKLGVRSMTLTWNNRNAIADGIMETHSKGGLSDFGVKVVHEMNRLGMIIDVSHISEKGFYDVMDESSKPVIASHSNAKGICSHARNLDDNQIKIIAKKNGIIGINFYEPFLAEGRAGIDDIIRHIEYIISLVGVDYIGFGSDFDGIEKLPENIDGPEVYEQIINRLLQLNYSDDQIIKLTHGNYLRVLSQILK